MSDNEPCENTDVELWREREGDYYAPSIHLTIGGGIGINVGGMVYVKSLRDWHALATPSPAAATTDDDEPLTQEEIAAFTRERSLREEAERQRDRLATKLAKVGVWSTRYRDDAVMWRKFDDALKFSELPTHDGFTRWPKEGRCQDAAKLAANPAPAVACEERRVRQQKPVPLEFGTFGYIRKDSEHTDGAHYDQRRREAGVMTKDVAADVLAFWMLPFDMPPLEQTEARNAIKAAILTLTRSARVVDASPLASAERVVEAAKEMRLEMRCTYGWDSQHDNPVPCTTKAGHPCDCSVCDSARAFDQSLREGGR